MKKLCVIGSFNVDIFTTLDRFPMVGESVRTHSFDIFVGGGKGANQAVALGKLGADVRMVGKLGDRFYGPEYMKVLETNHVKCDTVIIEKDCYPGIAIVAVDGNSDNILFVYPGANDRVDIPFIESKWDVISACDIFLFQLEISLEPNLHVLKKLKALNKLIILDPAPAMKIPQEEVFSCADYITPNETELQAFSGIPVNDEEDIRKAAGILLDRGARTVIAKAGKNGAYIVTRDEFTHIPPFRVKALDPTAAGDCFNAGFAYSLAEGKDIYESARFANAVAALSTTAVGAQNAMPVLDQVIEFMKQSDKK